MHRISSRQDALLAELSEQTRQLSDLATQIVGLTQTQHDILQEVHPDIGVIRSGMETISEDLGHAVESLSDELDTAVAKVTDVEELVRSTSDETL